MAPILTPTVTCKPILRWLQRAPRYLTSTPTVTVVVLALVVEPALVAVLAPVAALVMEPVAVTVLITELLTLVLVTVVLATVVLVVLVVLVATVATVATVASRLVRRRSNKRPHTILMSRPVEIMRRRFRRPYRLHIRQPRLNRI